MLKSKPSKLIFLILGLFLIYILILILEKKELFWDSAVYIGMSRYIFSLGKLGFYELIRPPFFSFILGFLAFLGINFILAGQIIVILSALSSIFIVYLLSKNFFGEKNALLITFLFSIAPTMVFFSSKILNDTFSMFLGLIVIYLFIKEKNLILIGAIIGLSTLTRFPNLLFLVCLIFYLIIDFILIKKSKDYYTLIKKCFYLIFGVILVFIPYLIFNQIKFGNFLEPFIQASNTINIVSQSVNKSIFYYPLNLLVESIFIIFFIFGIIFTFKGIKKNKPFLLMFIISSLFLLYYSNIGHKEMRYLLIIFPYLFLISYKGFVILFSKLKNNKLKRYFLFFLVIICILQSINLTIYYDKYYFIPFDEDIQSNYYNSHLEGFSIVSGPHIFVYQDIEAEIIYWVRQGMFEYYEEMTPSNYLINDCDLFCLEEDFSCNSEKQKFIEKIKENYPIKFHKNLNNCNYYLFSR